MLLGGCEGRARADVARSAEQLLAAASAGDRVAFEAHVDRSAVRDDLRRQMQDLARANGLEVDGGPSDFALDRMIGPDAVRRMRLEAEAEALKTRIRMDGRRACLPGESDRCLLTFAKADGDWRLVGMQARDLDASEVLAP